MVTRLDDLRSQAARRAAPDRPVLRDANLRLDGRGLHPHPRSVAPLFELKDGGPS